MNILWLDDENVKDIAGGGVVAANDHVYVSVDNSPRDIKGTRPANATDLSPADGVTVYKL